MMSNDGFANGEVRVIDDEELLAVLEKEKMDLDGRGIDGLAEFLERDPDATEKLAGFVYDRSMTLPPASALVIDEQEQLELQTIAAQVLETSREPAATSLGELRARARLTLNHVAKKIGLN